MPWEPGKSGNPNGYKGPRDRARRQVFDTIKNLGHKDALETLSYLHHNEQIDPAIRVAAASALAPYCHPKMQATPTPRFIELQIDIPEFVHVSDAEAFLAKIALLTAKGHLDIQSAQELSGLVKTWIDTQYAKDELQYKISPPETRDQTITITGGLPALPGTRIDMPQLNGHIADARALAAPTDVVPPPAQVIEDQPKELSTPTPGELKAQGPHPLQKHHFAPDEPGKNSTNGGGETKDQGP